MFTFGLLICLVSCKNNDKQVIKSERESKIDSTDLLDSLKIVELEKANEDTTHYFSKEQIDSVWKTIAKKLPKSDLKKVLKKPFYKHYVGKFGGKVARLDLTLILDEFYHSFEFSGVLNIENKKEKVEMFSTSEYNDRTVEKELQGYVEFYSSNANLEKDTLSLSIKGSFSDNLQSFKGYCINNKDLSVTSFDLHEDYTDGSSKLEILSYQKFQKYKNTTVGNRLVRVRGADFDSTLNLKLSILESLIIEDYLNGKKIPERFFSNFDSACIFSQRSFNRFKNKTEKDEGLVGSIFIDRTATIRWNYKNLLVIQYKQWQGGGSGYPELSTYEKIYDVDSGVILTEKDILKPNYKDIILKAKKDYSEFEVDYFKRKSTGYAYMTHQGLTMVGTGVHGWTCNYFFIPLSEMKNALKPSFVEKYLKN